MTLTITSYYICALFRAEVDGQAALKGHIESVHLEDLFKFPCGICGFKAEGPKYLREHLAKEHDVDDVLSMVTVVLEDWEIVTLEVVSMLESDEEAPTSVRSRVPARNSSRLLLSTSGDSWTTRIDKLDL